MKKLLFTTIIAVLAQSCAILNIKQDNAGTSKSLVFTENKKWLINNLYTDLYYTDRDRMNLKIFETFSDLSKGNAYTLDKAKKENLMNSNLPFVPSEEAIEDLKRSTDFDFLVNTRTVIVKDQLGPIEFSAPLSYSKNEAFAVLEVYDIKTGKKIYTQKASAMNSMEGKDVYPRISAEQEMRTREENKGPFFILKSSQISVKCLKKILKDIKANAIK